MTKEEVKAILPESCEYYPIPYGVPDWYRFRARGIGGSDIGTIAHINPWGSPMKLYHQKLGTVPQDPDNESMFHGRMQEEYIAMLWEHWSGGDDSHMKNIKEGRKIRESIRINGYVVNKKYPWLFASTDRLIDYKGLNGGLRMDTLEPLDKYGVLELKTMSFWAERAYDDGLPPYYLTQVQGYMLIMEADYAEIAVFKQGNKFEVEIVLADKEVQEQIIRITRNWYERHLAPGYMAKQAFDKALIRGDEEGQEKAQAEIDHFEPPPDPSREYQQFVSDTFNKEIEHQDAPPGLYDTVKKATMLKQLINKLGIARDGLLNVIRRDHKKYGAEYLMYGDMGYSRYYIKGKNKNFELNTKIKEMPSEERITEEIKKLNITYGNVLH